MKSFLIQGHSYFKGAGSCIDLVQLIEHIGSSTQGHMKYDYPQPDS